MVYQQIRALAVLDTAAARQKGYPLRVSFSEFLRRFVRHPTPNINRIHLSPKQIHLNLIAFRYKFLAFDFDENVELTKDNCRLLLIRLKMEGWIIGNSKVFLKYYNVEYLSRFVKHHKIKWQNWQIHKLSFPLSFGFQFV